MIKDDAGHIWLELGVYCKKARLAQHGGVQSGVQGPDDFLIISIFGSQTRTR